MPTVPGQSYGPGKAVPGLFTRRQLLSLIGAAGLGLILGWPRLLFNRTKAIASRRHSSWSNPATWGGQVPGKRDIAVISHKVVLNTNARVSGVIIKRGGRLIFHQDRSLRLRSTGNVVVHGRLVMRPSGPHIAHRVSFHRVDEKRFKGGGHRVRESDVGLWVMGRGALDIAGSPKLAWTRTAGPVAAGAVTIEIQEDPIGWQPGDTLAITPTLPASKDSHLAYDTATIAAVSGRTISLKNPTAFDHPAVEVRTGELATPEVLNLTRNVFIEGTRKGRSHVFIRSSVEQRLGYATIRYVGPRKRQEPVLGRYGLHFHHCMNGSRGSVVEGVLVRDGGNHALVPHVSHGITFRDCIVHQTSGSAFWWDLGDLTDDTLWERCVASLSRERGDDVAGIASGFTLGGGVGNRSIGCVAVGGDKAGYHWPGKANQIPNVWTFQECIAHNNAGDGIFVWQNDPNPHDIENFVCFHNWGAGVQHGAYGNRYHYVGGDLIGNRTTGVLVRANNRGGKGADDDPVQRPIAFRDIHIDAGGADYGLYAHHHVNPSTEATLIQGCHFRGHSVAGVACQSATNNSWFRVEGCTYEGNEFWMADDCHPQSIIEHVDAGLILRRKDQPGTFRPEWNASVT